MWHNYGFDRHIIEAVGIRLRGFGGDTLHMARPDPAANPRQQGAMGSEEKQFVVISYLVL